MNLVIDHWSDWWFIVGALYCLWYSGFALGRRKYPLAALGFLFFAMNLTAWMLP